MVKQLTLPIASDASLLLEKLTEIEMASSWRCTLVHGDTRAVLGEAMLSRCMQGLAPLADRSLEFFPKEEGRDEYAYVMAFSDQQGPSSTLYVFRTGEALELAWQDREMKMHREGIILDAGRVSTWPRLLEDAAGEEIWPPSKYYRMMRERGSS